MISMQLKNKIALIGGAGRNNGRAISLRFAEEGANLILVARTRQAEIDEVVKACEAKGAKVLPFLGDVSKPEDVQRIVDDGLKHFGRIDVLVTVAGLRKHKDFWEISYEEWLEVFAVNLHSTFLLAKAVVPSMMKQRSGSIVALGGMASITSQPQRAHVVASKTGLYGLIKSLALELGPYGIRANLLALSTIRNQRLNPEDYPELKNGERPNEEIESIPLKREGAREEVANVALFLASDQSSYVTGDRIICAGGKYM